MSTSQTATHFSEQSTPAESFNEKLYAADLEAAGHSPSYAAEKAHRVEILNIKAQEEDQVVARSKMSKAEQREATMNAEVFTSGGDIEFRTAGWGATFVLLVKTQIGLGVLSLPSTLSTLGLVPGLIMIVFFGLLTTYGSYVLGQWRSIFPGCHNVGDVGYILGGRFGREFAGWGYLLFFIFNAGSGMLAFSIALNTITEHATCTVVFTLIAAIIIMAGNTFRTFKGISYLSWIGICFIVPAVLIVTISVGISDRPPAAPPGPFDRQLQAFGNPTFAEAIGAVLNCLFAWSGNVAFLSIISEMSNPRDFNKALYLCQIFSMAFYVSVSVVLWKFAGVYIANPALGSAGPLIKKIAYGVAIPGLLAGPIIYIHLSSKYLFVRLLKGTRHYQSATPLHWITWITLVVCFAAIAFIIASSIPFFGSLIGLIAAIFCSMFCVSLEGVMWIYMNDHKRRSGKKTSLNYKLLYFVNVFVVLCGFFLLGVGLWSSIVGIRDQFAAGSIGTAFSCARNDT